jgi:hypothetical protein
MATTWIRWRRAGPVLAVGAVLLLMTGCVPVLVTPRQTFTQLTPAEAYAEVVRTIDTQPYPASTGGWTITEADREGGFVRASMSYRVCGYVPYHFALYRCHTYRSLVTVTLVARSEARTLVVIGRSDDAEAVRLEAALWNALELVSEPPPP